MSESYAGYHVNRAVTTSQQKKPTRYGLPRSDKRRNGGGTPAKRGDRVLMMGGTFDGFTGKITGFEHEGINARPIIQIGRKVITGGLDNPWKRVTE